MREVDGLFIPSFRKGGHFYAEKKTLDQLCSEKTGKIHLAQTQQGGPVVVSTAYYTTENYYKNTKVVMLMSK